MASFFFDLKTKKMMRKKFNALFVDKKSNYMQVPAFDCFDSDRNALTVDNCLPAVCHPPCQLWSKLRAFSNRPKYERYYFIWSVMYVRKYGGIVEHPVDSYSWKHYEIVKPGLIDRYGGFTYVIDQGQFGHYMRKRTMLYIVGIKPSHMPAEYIMRYNHFVDVSKISQVKRSETMPDLIEWFTIILSKIHPTTFDNDSKKPNNVYQIITK